MSEPLKKSWLEAGAILYFEKQPDKPFIPRRGESFTSIAVYKTDDVNALLADKDATIATIRAERAAHGEDYQRLCDQLAAKEAEARDWQVLLNKRDTLQAELLQERAIKEAEKKILLAEVEKNAALKAELAAVVQAAGNLVHKLRFSVDREFVIAEATAELGAVLENTPASARALLDELERHRKAHVRCEAGDPLDTVEQLMEENRALLDEVGRLRGELPGTLKGERALADEKCRCFLERATKAEAERDALRGALEQIVNNSHLAGSALARIAQAALGAREQGNEK